MKMKSLNTWFGLGALLLASFGAQAQVTTDPPEYQDPEAQVKIVIDINALDASLDHTQNLLDAAGNGEDLYIWTWSPAEHPANHPLVNGTGSAPWKESNDSLILTNEGNGIYSWTIIPTEFYEVDAQTVFANDIKFLVKPKDGGGYGDPDIKSEDLTLLVDPPVTTRNPAFLFPGTFNDDDLVMLYYDNNEESNAGMQNLASDDCWFYAEATLSDSTTVSIAPNIFTVPNYPQLQMNYKGDGIFKNFFVPRDFFAVPSDKTITKIEIYIQRKIFTGGSSRITYDIVAELGCD